MSETLITGERSKKKFLANKSLTSIKQYNSRIRRFKINFESFILNSNFLNNFDLIIYFGLPQNLIWVECTVVAI